ncbi:MAG: hypothetical protein IJT60_06475, partial [Clostridia bacterium]|nr:hypothetical protein [Clostridia bacterium]
ELKLFSLFFPPWKILLGLCPKEIAFCLKKKLGLESGGRALLRDFQHGIIIYKGAPKVNQF